MYDILLSKLTDTLNTCHYERCTNIPVVNKTIDKKEIAALSTDNHTIRTAALQYLF